MQLGMMRRNPSPVRTSPQLRERRLQGARKMRDASHRVDPSAPSGFKLFGFGKKKKDAEAEAASKAAVAAPVSTYAPGNGVVEEEVIEGEEFDATPHGRRHKADDHDTDDYEEQTLPSNMRTGDLGEMLQEAHLDHRIQMNFDEKGVEEDECGRGRRSHNGNAARAGPRRPRPRSTWTAWPRGTEQSTRTIAPLGTNDRPADHF